MELDSPIFIVGIGRCGSTIFHRILCEHPRISWLTGFADWNPSRPGRNRSIMEMADWPFLCSFVRRVYPSECYRFWEHHCPGFRRPFRDLNEGDLSERSRIRVIDALGAVTSKRRPRLAMKITGWPRLGLLSSIFPNAKFIHLGRDGGSLKIGAGGNFRRITGRNGSHMAGRLLPSQGSNGRFSWMPLKLAVKNYPRAVSLICPMRIYAEILRGFSLRRWNFAVYTRVLPLAGPWKVFRLWIQKASGLAISLSLSKKR